MRLAISFDNPRLAPLFLVAAVSLWSGNFIAGRWIGAEVDAVGLNFWRWLIALVVLAPMSLGACRRHFGHILAAWRYLALLGLTGVAVFHVCVYQALSHTDATNALLMLSTAPALIMVLSRAFLDEGVSTRQWIGVVLSLSGAVIIACRGDLAVLGALGFGAGERWMMLAVPAWAAYSVLLKRRPTVLPQSAVLTASVVAGLAWMLPLVLLRPDLLDVRWTPGVAAAVGYIALGASVIAFLGWNRGVAVIGPARAGVFLHLMPVIGTLLAVLLLGESLHGYHAIGAPLVFGGIALGQYRSRLASARARGEFSRSAS